MTQIVDERLKKMCDECHSHLDKPCAWLSLGNEYCTEIMDIQQELQRKDNNWNELKEFILNHYIVGHTVQNGSLDMIINKMKELENGK